jgi:hypothetical protein
MILLSLFVLAISSLDLQSCCVSCNTLCPQILQDLCLDKSQVLVVLDHLPASLVLSVAHSSKHSQHLAAALSVPQQRQPLAQPRRRPLVPQPPQHLAQHQHPYSGLPAPQHLVPRHLAQPQLLVLDLQVLPQHLV